MKGRREKGMERTMKERKGGKQEMERGGEGGTGRGRQESGKEMIE